MYKILGGDGKEYGPVTPDQVRQWVAEGRATGATLVQKEGTADWKPLSSFPEFAALASTPPLTTAAAVPASINALQAVQGPAIALIIVAILGFLAAGLSLISTIFGLGLQGFNSMNNPEVDRIVQMMTGAMGIISNIVGLLVSVLILFGALKLKKLESYSFAMAATIVAMLPCISPCCCIGLPIGIWSLVILMKPEVKTAFH
jgi:hypothetical protein